MEITIPDIGESVFEATLAKWHKTEGDRVEKDELLCELETDKITLELRAEAAGTLSIAADEGATLKIGATIGSIKETDETAAPPPAEEGEGERKGAPVEKDVSKKEAEKEPEEKKEEPPRKPDAAPETEEGKGEEETEPVEKAAPKERGEKREKEVPEERITRQRMTPIRRTIAARLLEARQQTAMLTTFNEVDLSRVQELRRRHRESFEKKHGVSLGLMSFFVKASVEALKEFPEVNARIDGEDIVYQHFYDIGIAVGSEKGLLVPVLRNADRLHFAEIEKGIKEFVDKARNNRISLEDLVGGTFTISNGGVYGSLLSTPILNPPQSAVLGMHAIQDRPVARDAEVVIRPMMYLALSYDHRIIDGKEAVGYLRRVKEYIEAPEEMLLEL